MSDRIDVSRARPLPTWQDAVDEVLLAFDVDAVGRHLLWAKRAVRMAARTFAGLMDWTYYLKNYTLQVLEPFSDGTIGISTAGVVTLSGSTWPSDMLYRRLYLAGEVYYVASITSSTVLVVSNPPVEAIATGSSYQAILAEYPLPANARRITELEPTSGTAAVCYVPPTEALSYRNWQNTAGTPSSYTIRGDQRRAGRHVVEFSPMPTSERRYEYMAYISPGDAEPAVYLGGAYEYNVGTATWLDGGTTITGVGTVWTSKMVGSIIRFSANNSPPSGEFGRNPAVATRVVTAVASGTSLTVDEAMVGAGTTLGYALADPLDVPPELWNLFIRLAELEFSKGTKPGPDVDRRQQMYVEALHGAMAADQSWRPGGMSSWAWLSLDEFIPT